MPTLLITGANRGIGLEFVRQYAADGWQIVATCRDPSQAGELAAIDGVRIETLDMKDRQALTRLGDRLGDLPLDLVIANAGVMGPERAQSAADAEAWLETMAVNAIAPVLLAQAVAANVERARGKLVAITSRMGSIADNEAGGYIAYRSSKAALNAAWKSLTIELAPRGVTTALLHPGWVQTRMGGPTAPLTAQESVSGLRKVIAGLTPERTGIFIEYSGEEIPW